MAETYVLEMRFSTKLFCLLSLRFLRLKESKVFKVA
jgi:hypothetical protein